MKHQAGRRKFLRDSACLALALSPAWSASAKSVRNDKRPNIIFLMSDQQRWDCLGRINPKIKTPALDKIAETGILFDQAVCQGPMCVPSRYSMMLGLYPSQVGVLTNSMQLTDERLPCDPLPEILRKAGYQTAGFGKTHWGGPGHSTRGFEVRRIGQPSNVLPEKGALMMGDDNPEGLARYQEETKDYGPGEEGIAGYIGCTSKVAEKDHRDGWVFNQCLDFIDSGLDPEKPLFLYLSFLKPHAGNNVPPGFEDIYAIDDIPVPRQPPWDKDAPSHALGSNREKMYIDFWSKASRNQWQEMIRRYWANCSWIDSMFGRVMEKLRAGGLLDNCLIVYVADHGEMLGERYYRFNKYCLFESSVRVPMILGGTALPAERRGSTDHRPAELVDVMPTILRIAKVEHDSSKPGRDLLGGVVRKATFCEFHKHANTPAYMWRERDHKLILVMKRARAAGEYHVEDIASGELYDLKKDPQEWNNLFSEKNLEPVRKRMTAGLLKHLATYRERGYRQPLA